MVRLSKAGKKGKLGISQSPYILCMTARTIATVRWWRLASAQHLATHSHWAELPFPTKSHSSPEIPINIPSWHIRTLRPSGKKNGFISLFWYSFQAMAQARKWQADFLLFHTLVPTLHISPCLFFFFFVWRRKKYVESNVWHTC